LIWRGTIDGIFTVRSAYHMRKEFQDSLVAQSSNPGKGPEFWKFIWPLEVPNPVKLFIWHVCNKVLPVRSNLLRRKIIDDDTCPCGRAEETIIHALWNCPVAQDVWGSKLSIFHKCGSEASSFMALFEHCLSRFSGEQVALLAVIALRIWFCRNSCV